MPSTYSPSPFKLSSSTTFTSSSFYKTTNAITTSPRLHGSYEALKYGSVLDGLADLTGGVAECLPLRGDPTGSGRLLVELLDMTSVITANIQVGDKIVFCISFQRLYNVQNFCKSFPLPSCGFNSNCFLEKFFVIFISHHFPHITLQVEKESNKNKDSKVEEKMANGITIGTNYRVYAVQKVQTVAGEIVQLVHLKVLKHH